MSLFLKDFLSAYLWLCPTVHDTKLENSFILGGLDRGTARVVLYYEVSGINGWVCIWGHHWKHKVPIQRAGWAACEYIQGKKVRRFIGRGQKYFTISMIKFHGQFIVSISYHQVCWSMLSHENRSSIHVGGRPLQKDSEQRTALAGFALDHNFQVTLGGVTVLVTQTGTKTSGYIWTQNVTLGYFVSSFRQRHELWAEQREEK